MRAGHALRAGACAAAVALLGTALEPVPTVRVAGTATATQTPDRLFVAVEISSLDGAVGPPVSESDVADLLTRLYDEQIPASAVVAHYVTRPSPAWLRRGASRDPRPYGVVLLRFDRPDARRLATIRRTIPNAFATPPRDGLDVNADDAWYGLDDCTHLQATSQALALGVARRAAAPLAAVAGLVDEDPTDVRVDASNAARAYLCGRTAMPDVPPPSLHVPVGAHELAGRVAEESTVALTLPALQLVRPPPPPPPPAHPTSLRPPALALDGALRPGTLAASVAVAAADVGAGGDCNATGAVPAAFGLAWRRASLAGAAFGLAPGRTITAVDATPHRAVCPPAGPDADPAGTVVALTFAARPAPRDRPALDVRGRAEIDVAADRALVSVHFAKPQTGQIDAADVSATLAAAGADTRMLTVDGSDPMTVTATVAAPTARSMTRLGAAVDALADRYAIAFVRRGAAFAVDDCTAPEERVLRAAAADARTRARRLAAARHVRLAEAVAARDDGLAAETYCGPGVLTRLDPVTLATSQAAFATPAVSFAATVDASYAIARAAAPARRTPVRSATRTR